ncbi:hypothetical protein NEOLI_000385 [Neolecta irregularis DAH-3]|uniref:Uncharacterized protein n=1 Tax=Neolecta irregularis (strain DAH-3) TaxID=1198029 RepID=A0A1U7LUL7_NEOID|nr:hypothetical protein NEOLI_000385 [Neolecta irregularis DAH-3]|eukprot:OLL26308.1 hypothetical protein NEOLI_000385 [Neolecta irregularis DAH-3]
MLFTFILSVAVPILARGAPGSSNYQHDIAPADNGHTKDSSDLRTLTFSNTYGEPVVKVTYEALTGVDVAGIARKLEVFILSQRWQLTVKQKRVMSDIDLLTVSCDDQEKMISEIQSFKGDLVMVYSTDKNLCVASKNKHSSLPSSKYYFTMTGSSLGKDETVSKLAEESLSFKSYEDSKPLTKATLAGVYLISSLVAAMVLTAIGFCIVASCRGCIALCSRRKPGKRVSREERETLYV